MAGVDDDTLDDLVSAPKKHQGDEAQITERDNKDLIEGDRYARARSNGSSVPFGIGLAQLRYGDTA
ncbi:MAG: hypothetical protein KDA71_16130 [Planctomycetales bacterium]|nr:hypothetical protein [Planctomycetales bacterium]